METNANYTIVGAFVIILLGFIIFAIIWLSAGYSRIDYNTYQVDMKESVSGLSLDAPVEYNGVSVGSVTNIKISQKNLQIVELLLKIKKGTPITQATVAKFDMRTLSGIGYIQLIDNGKNPAPLLPQPGQDYPIIPTIPSIYLRLDTALTDINNSFNKISDSFNKASLSMQALLSKQNIYEIQQNLISLHQLTGSLNQSTANLNNLTHSLSEIANDIKQNPSVLIRGKQQPPLGPGEK
jgi:phospholipid/cholesterol/gamma-HCH transport system substrate-binding protein